MKAGKRQKKNGKKSHIATLQSQVSALQKKVEKQDESASELNEESKAFLMSPISKAKKDEGTGQANASVASAADPSTTLKSILKKAKNGNP